MCEHGRARHALQAKLNVHRPSSLTGSVLRRFEHRPLNIGLKPTAEDVMKNPLIWHGGSLRSTLQAIAVCSLHVGCIHMRSEMQSSHGGAGLNHDAIICKVRKPVLRSPST